MSEISVVIVSIVGGKALVECLESMSAVPGECLVLLDDGKNNIMNLREQFPSMHFISRGKLPVPMARKRGVELASGEIVALLEDTCLLTPGWYDAVAAAFSESRVVAAGGPVVLSPKLKGNFLALGCGEYGRFHPDRFVLLGEELADVELNAKELLAVTRLPGNNLAYRREPLMDVMGDNGCGLIEGEVNEQLRSRGFKLYMHPEMLVTYCMMDRDGARLKTRFNHGRLFAGNRVTGQGWRTRIGWFLKSLLLPAVLTMRGWSYMTSAVETLAWPKVMIWIFLMETAWSIGEAVGYLVGAGRSLDAWH